VRSTRAQNRALSCRELESQTGIRIHRIRYAFRRLIAWKSADLRSWGYRFKRVDAYPQKYPHEAVAAGGSCWTSMDETAAYKCEA
jgi:hypothetical protein